MQERPPQPHQPTQRLLPGENADNGSGRHEIAAIDGQINAIRGGGRVEIDVNRFYAIAWIETHNQRIRTEVLRSHCKVLSFSKGVAHA